MATWDMPDLPAVKTMRHGIEPDVRVKTVQAMTMRQSLLCRPVSPALARAWPGGQHIRTVRWRAEHLLFEAETGHVCLHPGVAERLRIVLAETTRADLFPTRMSGPRSSATTLKATDRLRVRAGDARINPSVRRSISAAHAIACLPRHLGDPTINTRKRCRALASATK